MVPLYPIIIINTNYTILSSSHTTYQGKVTWEMSQKLFLLACNRISPLGKGEIKENAPPTRSILQSYVFPLGHSETYFWLAFSAFNNSK